MIIVTFHHYQGQPGQWLPMTTADVLRLQLDSSPLSSRVAVAVDDDDDDVIIARIRARAMTAGRRYTSRRRVTRSRQREESGRRSKPELPVEDGDSSTDNEFYDTDLETDDQPGSHLTICIIIKIKSVFSSSSI